MYRRYYGGYDENLESGGGFGADEACDCRDECESGCFEDERRPDEAQFFADNRENIVIMLFVWHQ